MNTVTQRHSDYIFEWFRLKQLIGCSLAALMTAFPSAVLAQDSKPATQESVKLEEDKDTIEEVVITGSRLRRSAENFIVPITVTTAEQIEIRGFTNVIQALAEDPIFRGNTSSAGGQGQYGDSFSFANVLGLGTQRTLVLFNGRRFVGTNQGTVFVPGNNTGAQVDLSIINPALLERTETTIASGGAVYGADAVAGAINLITKDDYEGLNVTSQFGITERGDGEEYRISAAYGQNFDDGKGNFAVSVEYFNQNNLSQNDRNFLNNGRATIANPLNGRSRNSADFSASAAAATLSVGGSLEPAFLPAGSDGISNTVSILDLVDPTLTIGGTLAGGTGGFSGIGQVISNGTVPGALAGAAADPAGFAFFAPSNLPAGVNPADVIASLAPGTATAGLSAGQLRQLALGLLQRNRPTPAEFFAANPGIDPNLFVGTFGDSDAFPSILNTDPATSALFPRIAVPLQFDTSGNLVPLNVGQRTPEITDINTVIGGEGFNLLGIASPIRASTERFSSFLQGHYDVRDNVTVFGDFLFARTKFDTFTAPNTHQSFGGSSGTAGLRIFIDENPFVTTQTLNTLNTLEAQGLNIGTQDGSRFITVSRNPC